MVIWTVLIAVEVLRRGKVCSIFGRLDEFIFLFEHKRLRKKKRKSFPSK
jgi:hypothetical protein